MFGVLIAIMAAFVALRLWGLKGVLALAAVLASAGIVLIASGFLLAGAIQVSRYMSTDPEGAATAARALKAGLAAAATCLAVAALVRWWLRSRMALKATQPGEMPLPEGSPAPA